MRLRAGGTFYDMKLRVHAPQAFSAVPVLYASQWLLTCFACPFSAPVACRVIDVLLIEDRPHCLLRVALALMAELEADLLTLDDFEDIITFIKARASGPREVTG